MFNVYIDYHSGDICDVPFYVGIGNSARVKNKQRSLFHSNVCKNHRDWYRKVVDRFSSWNDCIEVEKFLIAEIGRRDKGNGPLVNMTDGGEGIPGLTHTKRAREKMSASHTGKIRSAAHKTAISAGQTGKKLAPEQRAFLSCVRKGAKASEKTRLKMSSSHKGLLHSNETKKKMALSHMGLPAPNEGMIWVTDGSAERFVTSSSIPHGWSRGRKKL